jgi:hypothetical protein
MKHPSSHVERESGVRIDAKESLKCGLINPFALMYRRANRF